MLCSVFMCCAHLTLSVPRRSLCELISVVRGVHSCLGSFAGARVRFRGNAADSEGSAVPPVSASASAAVAVAANGTVRSGVECGGGALTEVDAALSSDADSETADGDSDGDDARGGGEERTETAAEAEYDLAALSDPAFLDTVLKRSNGRVPIVDVQSRVTQVRCLLCTRAVSVVFIWSD